MLFALGAVDGALEPMGLTRSAVDGALAPMLLALGVVDGALEQMLLARSAVEGALAVNFRLCLPGACDTIMEGLGI